MWLRPSASPSDDGKGDRGYWVVGDSPTIFDSG